MHLKNLDRARLLEQLDDGPNLSVLCAPPGSGKTQLMRTWASRASRSRPVIWCRLEREVTDSSGFWSALTTAAAWSGHIRPQWTPALDDVSAGGERGHRGLATLFSHHPGLVMVVDDLQHVVDDADELWQELVSAVEAYPALRLVVGTRWVPPSVLLRLRLRPAVRVLGPLQLAFTVEETAELLSDTGYVDPQGDLSRAVVEETRGHALSALSAVVAMDERPGSSSDEWRTAVSDQILLDLDALGVRSFLRSTAAAPHLDTSLARALTKKSDEEVTQLLARLESNGYGRWTQLEDGEKVFELVSPVREALRASGDEEKALADLEKATVVCEHLAAHGNPGGALQVAVRSGLYDQATKLYRRLVVTQPFSVTAGLEPALREIPTDEIKKYPILSVARGVALLSSPATSAGALQFLLPIAERDPVSVDEGSADDDLLELTAQSVVLGVLGRHDAAAGAALEAANRVADPDFARAVDPSLVTPLACQLSQSLFESGHVEAAQRLLSQGIAVATPELVRFCAIYGRAWYGLDGRLPEALDMDSRVDEGSDHPLAAAAGVTWGPRTHDLETVGGAALLLDRWEHAAAADLVAEEESPRWDPSRAWRSWVRLHAALGLGTSALEVQRIATSLESASVQLGSLGFAALGNAMSVAWLANGQVSRARRVLTDLTENFPGQGAPARLLVELATAGPDAALHLLPELRSASGHSIRSRAALATVGAAAALRADASTLAATFLTEAATMHAEHGCRAHLTYLPETDRAALIALARGMGTPECLAYVADLPSTPAGGTTSTAPTRLTAREQAVLQALAVHRSRVNVAQALHVSENTVKSQMRSLYRKLGATDRASAISRAVELDLLSPDLTDAF